MLEDTIESTKIYPRIFPMDWIEIGPSTFSSHAQHVANLAKPQPAASIGGVELFLPPNVYHPGVGLSSSLLVDALLNENMGRTVLDLGCGSGFVGISLYRQGMDLILADISNASISSTTENLRRIGIPGRVILSDLFSNLKGMRFDTILFNPPLFDKTVEHEAEIALCDPNGDLLTRFLTEAPQHLTSTGCIYFMASNLMNREALLSGLGSYRYRIISSSFSTQSGVSRWIVSARSKH
ncbi:methyltransferase [Pseudomonas kielensis]|uniref:methyltransferase n=1 Tax=Pseudomonas kielensis TaxID=2762577 RepID=UPI0038A85B29